MTNNFLLPSQLLIMPGHQSLIPDLLLFNIYLRYKMEFFTNASVKKKSKICYVSLSTMAIISQKSFNELVKYEFPLLKTSSHYSLFIKPPSFIGTKKLPIIRLDMNEYTEKNYICVFTFQPYMIVLESIFKFQLTGRKGNKNLTDKNTFYLISYYSYL